MALRTVTTGPNRAASHLERRLLLWLFVLMAVAFSLFQEGVIIGYDGQTMYAVTESIVERGTVAISAEWNTSPGREGLQYSRYGPGLSLAAVVPYVLARPLAALSGHREEILAAAVAWLMPLLNAALVVALYLLARRLGARLGAALLVGAGGVLGTFALPYTKDFFSEPLATLCLVIAIERLLAARPATAGLAMAAAVLTRAQTLLLAPVLLFVAWRRQGVPGLLRTSPAWLPDSSPPSATTSCGMEILGASAIRTSVHHATAQGSWRPPVQSAEEYLPVRPDRPAVAICPAGSGRGTARRSS